MQAFRENFAKQNDSEREFLKSSIRAEVDDIAKYQKIARLASKPNFTPKEQEEFTSTMALVGKNFVKLASERRAALAAAPATPPAEAEEAALAVAEEEGEK